MSINIKTLVPAKAIHPGEILIDELKDRAISQKDFSQQTGIPITQLNEIIKGKRAINADIAHLISKALKMDAILWMNLQSNYDLDLEKIREKTQRQLIAMDKWDMIKDHIPLPFFKKEKIITGNPTVDIPNIYTIYGVRNSDELIAVYSMPAYARFRKSEKLAIDKLNVIGWVKLVHFKSLQIKVNPFNLACKEPLIEELKQIFKANRNTVESTKKILLKYGIKLVIQPHPEKCAVDGIAFWSDGNPAIGVSLRHKRVDNFAFTILHELGHIFLHLVNNNNAEFIDLDSETEYGQSSEEKEANNFSKNTLIPLAEWKEFMSKKSSNIHKEKVVQDFANAQNIHPAIVYGRFSIETGIYKIRTKIEKSLN
ncbi:HigA family addiction module antitoxin [Pedobacter sp. MC2016-15]|uniref:HigA family addiction module antitoxin n=1 Tax=Pedobacter sp. MC2016-15 TaxID=2994473 RepID=UPI00224648C0|nr:HigA family addiction module antitoxin [Pedobacter sp. MC2016-15]MCX2478564.1 HigA family addiction module antitoxin [Pedobacter sp. MC2016-15]